MVRTYCPSEHALATAVNTSYYILCRPRGHLDGAQEKRQIYDDQHGIVVTEVLQKSKEGGGAKKRKRR